MVFHISCTFFEWYSLRGLAPWRYSISVGGGLSIRFQAPRSGILEEVKSEAFRRGCEDIGAIKFSEVETAAPDLKRSHQSNFVKDSVDTSSRSTSDDVLKIFEDC
jgi:hypothetical protein